MVWVAAAAEYVTILGELGGAAEACVAAEAFCRQCEALQISALSAGLQRAFALAEAQRGDYTSAAARLDALIAARGSIRASFLAPDYEARARVAIAANDQVNAERFATLASGFESVVLGGERRAELITADAERVAGLEHLPDAAARATRVLELLVNAAGARGGYLYYHQQASELECAATRHVAPDSELDRFASGYFQQELERAGMTTVFTEVDATAGASWTNAQGDLYRVALLQCQGGTTYVGIVVLCGMTDPALSAQCRSLANALSARVLELRDCVAVQID
jgi:hypothetical protein